MKVILVEPHDDYTYTVYSAKLDEDEFWSLTGQGTTHRGSLTQILSDIDALPVDNNKDLHMLHKKSDGEYILTSYDLGERFVSECKAEGIPFRFGPGDLSMFLSAMWVEPRMQMDPEIQKKQQESARINGLQAAYHAKIIGELYPAIDFERLHASCGGDNLYATEVLGMMYRQFIDTFGTADLSGYHCNITVPSVIQMVDTGQITLGFVSMCGEHPLHQDHVILREDGPNHPVDDFELPVYTTGPLPDMRYYPVVKVSECDVLDVPGRVHEVLAPLFDGPAQEQAMGL